LVTYVFNKKQQFLWILIVYLANLFLFAFEYKWIMKQVRYNKFKGCSQCIDDLLLINNDNNMKIVMNKMYPLELKLIPDDTNSYKDFKKKSLDTIPK